MLPGQLEFVLYFKNLYELYESSVKDDNSRVVKTTQTDSGGSDTVTDLIITVISVSWPEHSPKTELGHNIDVAGKASYKLSNLTSLPSFL